MLAAAQLRVGVWRGGQVTFVRAFVSLWSAPQYVVDTVMPDTWAQTRGWQVLFIVWWLCV